jgi:hypothetical protein
VCARLKRSLSLLFRTKTKEGLFSSYLVECKKSYYLLILNPPLTYLPFFILDSYHFNVSLHKAERTKEGGVRSIISTNEKSFPTTVA